MKEPSHNNQLKPSLSLTPVMLLLVITFLVGAVGVSWFRQYGKTFFMTKDSLAPVCNKAFATKWLDAVNNGNQQRAILYAKQLVPDYRVQFPELDYIQVLKGNSISSAFLTDNFNKYDFYRWQDLVALKRVADTLGDVTGLKEVQALMTLVLTSIKRENHSGKKYPPLHLIQQWQQKSGNNIDVVRLFAELAKQRGYKVRLIAFKHTKTGRKLHYLCELSKAGNTTIVDLTFGKIIRNTTVLDLMSNRSLWPKEWPASLRDKMVRLVVFFPNEIQDYRRANQLLGQRLKMALSKDASSTLPYLPSDPKTQIDHYLQALSPESLPVGYWQIPVIALLSEKGQLPELWLFDENQQQNQNKSQN